MTFQDARLRLLAYVRNQVRNGELTERRFARLIGISQPHAHNVLKGARTLSPEIFDLILKYLHLSLLDLASIEEIEAQIDGRRARERVAEIAFLATPIGPGKPWPEGVNWRQSFSAPFASPTVSAELIMAHLGEDTAMNVTLASSDIALLDTSGPSRLAISPRGLYVVERSGEVVLRHLRWGARCCYLVTDANLDNPAEWEPLTLSSAALREAVKARVLWLGRAGDRDARPQRGRFLYDPISS